MTRPRRRASGAAASRSHPPASLAPPLWARGLVRASSPTGPIQAAGHHRRQESPVVAALPAARGALDERRLVGTDASDLSALEGASAGMVGATLRTRK
jgi:hypothetical protein